MRESSDWSVQHEDGIYNVGCDIVSRLCSRERDPLRAILSLRGVCVALKQAVDDWARVPFFGRLGLWLLGHRQTREGESLSPRIALAAS